MVYKYGNFNKARLKNLLHICYDLFRWENPCSSFFFIIKIPEYSLSVQWKIVRFKTTLLIIITYITSYLLGYRLKYSHFINPVLRPWGNYRCMSTAGTINNENWYSFQQILLFPDTDPFLCFYCIIKWKWLIN